MTVETLMGRIQAKEGIPTELVKLRFGKKYLEDWKSLEHYGIRDVAHCWFKLCFINTTHIIRA